jgi:hypothetical protein
MDFLRSSIDQRTFRTVPNRLATRRYLDHAWLMRICSNFSVDEPTQTLTCAAVTNVRDVNNIPESHASKLPAWPRISVKPKNATSAFIGISSFLLHLVFNEFSSRRLISQA